MRKMGQANLFPQGIGIYAAKTGGVSFIRLRVIEKILLICYIEYMKWINDFYKTKSGQCPVKKYLQGLNPKNERL